MSNFTSNTRGLLPPLLDDEAPSAWKPVYFGGTGSGNEVNAVPFSKGRVHVLTVGKSDVLVAFSRDGNKTDPVTVAAENGMVVPAGTVFPFLAFDNGKYGSTFVYITAADGSAGFDASVQQRES